MAAHTLKTKQHCLSEAKIWTFRFKGPQPKVIFLHTWQLSKSITVIVSTISQETMDIQNWIFKVCLGRVIQGSFNIHFFIRDEREEERCSSTLQQRQFNYILCEWINFSGTLTIQSMFWVQALKSVFKLEIFSLNEILSGHNTSRWDPPRNRFSLKLMP